MRLGARYMLSPTRRCKKDEDAVSGRNMTVRCHTRGCLSNARRLFVIVPIFLKVELIRSVLLRASEIRHDAFLYILNIIVNNLSLIKASINLIKNRLKHLRFDFRLIRISKINYFIIK